jgi:hypothetical protein
VCFGKGAGGAITRLPAAFTVLFEYNICVVCHSAIRSPKNFRVATEYLKVILLFHFEINFVICKWVKTLSG